MFQDCIRAAVFQRLRQRDTQAFQHLLSADVFARASQAIGRPLGENPLNLVNMTWLGVAAAWHGARSFADVLGLTLKLLRDADLWAAPPAPRTDRPNRSKHDPRGSDPSQVSEEAFAKARKLMPWSFWIALIMILAEDFEDQHPNSVRFKDYRLLALDGSCIDLENWKPLANHFGRAKNGTSRGRTQARMTMLLFPMTRIPLRYELTPLAEGERTVASRLLRGLRPNDLILMDRGFWSFGLFWQIQSQGAFFAIRLMSCVKPRVIRQLGPNDQLVSWTPSDRQWRKRGLPESIELRLIHYQVRGFRPSTVVTNALDETAITTEEWTGLVNDPETAGLFRGGLYHRRWEIETAFGELKTFQGMEGKLRGRTPETIIYELAGHVVLYLLIRWLMVEAAQAHDADPLRLSFTGARKELADLSYPLMLAAPRRAERELLPKLLERVASHRVPLRPGRRYPRPDDARIRNRGKRKKSPSAKQAAATATGQG